MDRNTLIASFENVDMSFFRGMKECNALAGLKIISKYLPQKGIEGAGKDIIYSVDVDILLEAGLTKEDAELLFKMNWFIDEETDSFACYVN